MGRRWHLRPGCSPHAYQRAGRRQEHLSRIRGLRSFTRIGFHGPSHPDVQFCYSTLKTPFRRFASDSTGSGSRPTQISDVWGQWVGEDPPSAGGAIVLEWVARCDPKPLIIVDSVIAFHPGAENDSNETRKYMAQYRMLTALGATVVLLHHIGKSETSRDYRGSSDYKASIDIGYKLTNLGDGARLSTLELKPFKQRFSVALRTSYAVRRRSL